jgi:four helix bundle protein
MSHEHGRGSYRDVIAWQLAMELCLKVYSISNSFPDMEKFGLAAEIRKTARSVVYNIAEGHRRRTAADFARFLEIARGSQAEVDTQLILAAELGYLEMKTFEELRALSDETGAVIYSLTNAIRKGARST